MADKSKRKKSLQLPYGYAEGVLQILTKQGLTLSKQSVYDIVNGRKKDDETTIKVWSAIKKVVTKHKRQVEKAQQLKSDV